MLPVLVLNIISFWVLRFPLVFFCSQIWGEVGIAYGVASSFVISSGIAAWYYRFGGWRRARVFD